MAGAGTTTSHEIPEPIYRRRIRAWTLYDWANSAFATVVLTAVLPVYFSQVAGATLPSKAVATARWSLAVSLSFLVVAILSPILGTISDVARSKKRFLSLFAGIGILATGLLVSVSTGDWVLAIILGIFGRIGFYGANSFYDALLPHVAREEDRDRVSARGYALGYLGGGLLLAINVVMINIIPDGGGHWGIRLSFLSVALWWAVFSLPILIQVPEPPAATAAPGAGKNIVSVSFQRLLEILMDIRQYKELFKFLIAFLIYNDGIGTIIAVSAIYGAELGLGSTELILAILMLQFVGIPYSLIFGRLPGPGNRRRPLYLAFVLFNVAALPLAGVAGTRLLPPHVTGAKPAPFAATAGAVGEGEYGPEHEAIRYRGSWEAATISGKKLGTGKNGIYKHTGESGARCELLFNGEQVEITYSLGPDRGAWKVEVDGQPLLDKKTGRPLLVEGHSPTERYGERITLRAGGAGKHRLSLVNQTGPGGKEGGRGNLLSLGGIKVLPAIRKSRLDLIIGLVTGIQVLGLILSYLLGPLLFSRLASSLNTKRSLLLAIFTFSIISLWGFFLDSVLEFWFLAWLVAVVLGGSQALSRSLYASLAPSRKSGQFFGFFSVMEKFSSFLGPLLFALAATIFGSSRPAILGMIAFFILGGFLLSFVNVEEGRRVALEEDRALLGGESPPGRPPE